jgi:hypothetical protein
MELLHGLNQSSANFSSKGRGGGMDMAATGVEVAVDAIIEDHLWFEDRWMVAPLCDERLTMLCGLILG